MALAFALPVAAQAADPAAATITSCRNDSLTVAGKLRLTGSGARKVRGATLELRFQALALFGLPRRGQWRSIGKKTSASNQEVFTGVGADNWIGVLEWRYKKGRKTVASGLARSEPLRIGAATGRANCVVAEGAKPVDANPPATFINPSDENWHHAPALVNLWATDDFSGVKSVTYSVDGGPTTGIANGGTFTIPTQGAHRVDWSATDVAGNTTTRSATVRVDDAPPTKPVITSPHSVTANPSPAIQWQPSTDSGAGIAGYYVAIKRPDGSVVASTAVGADATSAVPGRLDDGDYVATVLAADKTVDPAWATVSDPYPFRVDTKPEVTGTNPADGSILSGAAKSGNLTVFFDRPADPATVSATLHNVDTGSDVSVAADCSGAPCTSIIVNPAPSALPEGRYTLTVSGVKSDEGVPFATFTGHYSVPFIENGSMSVTSSTLLNSCTGSASKTYDFTSSANGEQATLDFDWANHDGASWKVEALYGSTPAGGNAQAAGAGVGSGHVHMGPFNLAQGTLTFKLTVYCNPDSTVDITNMLAARLP